MVFSAVSRVSSFEATADPVSKEKKKKGCRLVAPHSVKAKLIYPNRNGTIQHLAVSAHTLGPVHSKEGGGGDGVLAVKCFCF